MSNIDISYPVYRQIAELLTDDPSYAYNIDLNDLSPVIALSHNVSLMPKDVLKTVEGIRDQRTHKKLINNKTKTMPHSGKPKLNITIRKPTVASASTPETMVARLNADHTLASSLTTAQLESLLKWSDKMYDSGKSVDLLEDIVYDYVKRIYNQRVHKTNDKLVTMRSISSETGVGIKPTRERSVKLPIALRSLDNLFMGEGDVSAWSSKMPGSYHISCKMDGTSALYHDRNLYTRGDAALGRDISHVLPYLKLPEVNYSVRGEIVINKDVFDNKYMGKSNGNKGIRKVNRNSVSGALSSIHHMDPEFLGDLEFLAYEIITDDTKQMAPSEQFKIMANDGFKTAFNYGAPLIDDKGLSDKYTDLVENYEYKIDGLVIKVDQPYIYESSKNPEYAKAFKEHLAQDVAVTTVTNIEWNPSQYGYLIPTVVYEPVTIAGVTLSRATAHNAREVQRLGLGVGAEVEVIYWGMVNPRINKVLTPVTVSLPDVPYEWVPNDKDEMVNIRYKESRSDASSGTGMGASAGSGASVVDDMVHTIRMKKIYAFLVNIGAKGLGLTTVEKIYKSDEKLRSVGSFINLEEKHILFLGKQTSVNITKSIREAMEKLTLPALMAGSRVFGRGLGERKFNKVFEEYPDFISERYTRDQYITMLTSVDGFGVKTATLAADGMDDFWEFVDTQLSDSVLIRIMDNTYTETVSDDTVDQGIKGKNICITGFRDSEIKDYIERNQGTVQANCSSSTHMVIRKTSNYTNKKTEMAEARNIPILSQSDFRETYKL